MWTCPVCERKFKRRNQSHYCKSVNTVEEYIVQFSSEEQIKLRELRTIIRNTASNADEQLRWRMPTYVQKGNIIHFAMHNKHIGLYVGTSAVKSFEAALTHFHVSKGTIHLPKTEPLPQATIEQIIHFNIEKNENNEH